MNILENIKKRPVLYIIIAFAAGMLIGGLFNGNGNNHDQTMLTENTATEWTCSMHPQIRQPEPGKCPICAMDLIPVTHDHADAGMGAALKLGSTAMALADIQTTPVVRDVPVPRVRLYGKVVVDENKRSTISAWYPGRIEEQYISAIGTKVKKGQPLAKIYSPVLYTAQQEYVSVLESTNGFISRDKARKKLELLGMTGEQTDALEKDRKPSEYNTLNAPISGIVIMTGALTGDYINTGTVLYRLAALDQVWVELDAYESDLNLLSTGQSVEIMTPAQSGQTITGHIAVIEPVFRKGQINATVRVEMDNDQMDLLPGMTVQAVVNAVQPGWDKHPPLLIPVSAPLITGKRAVVYVADEQGPGRFEGRIIQLGPRVGDMYIVESGLSAGEKVVTNGNFKIDSALQIQAKPSMMGAEMHMIKSEHDHHAAMPSEKNNKTATKHDHAQMSMQTDLSTEQIATLYNSYFKVQAALSLDDHQGAVKAAKSIIDMGKSTQAAILKSARDIAQSPDLKTARVHFEPLSMAMIELAGHGQYPADMNLYQVNCPMAFDFKGADWLQTHKNVENPYFGSEMFQCGTVEKTIHEMNSGE